MDLEAIRVLLAVLEHGTVQGAAEALNTARATVRRRLRELEEAAGVALVVMVARPGQSPSDSNAGGPIASKDASAEAPTDPMPDPAPAAPPTQIADAAPAAPPMPGPLPAPESNDAEIERIEFGGASGRISHIEGVRGTTTVIWVEEDEEPADSERSL